MSQSEYDFGVKSSSKILLKSLLRKFYVSPRSKLISLAEKKVANLSPETKYISEEDFQKLRQKSGNSEEIENLHKEILVIYKYVKEICERHNLEFFAEGGTWIGAALCEGFIPWDDDMDLRMPRADYEKFIKIAERELPDHIKVLDCTKNKYSNANMLKIHNENTTFIETTKRNFPDQWSGVFVDITPFDFAPESPLEQNNLRKKGTKLFIYNLIRKHNNIKFSLNNYKSSWWCQLYEDNNLHPPKNWLSVFILYLIVMRHRVDFYSEKLDKLWQKYPKSTVIVCPERPWEKQGRILYLPEEYYAESIIMKFVDTVMPVPVGYEEISTLSYGFKPTLKIDDNMKYKHLKDALFDSKKSYKEYLRDIE